MTKAHIKHMVDRFLGWKLPESFNPDGGVSFKRTFNEHTAHPMKSEPSGTNLLDATQADAMVRYMIEGLPKEALVTTGAKIAKQLEEALRPFVESYRKDADPVGDSDLYDEQPRAVRVSLGDCRRAYRAIRELELMSQA
jgi:hypothetical protein